jgi:hypothetical protein
MAKRDHISFKTKLAAALCSLLHVDEEGRLVPIIPHEDAKNMHEDQILSLFHFDHFPIAKAFDGPETHWNLRPLLIKEHRVKTATKDAKEIAKGRRITKHNEEFRRKVLAKAFGELEQTSSKPKKKIQSAGFKGWRKFNGDIVRASPKKRELT